MKKFMGLFCLGLLLMGSAQAQEPKQPVVLELFTSQSCSSCPPTDIILGELADENDNIIALNCNVTYWNHLHWEDTLSKDFCTTRQRSYVRTLESRGPYTPQIVINGHHEMVESKERVIKSMIATEAEKHEIMPIGLRLDGNQLEINLPESPSNHTYALFLIPHGKRHTQAIPSGENKGRTVHYTNPVQDIISLGTWDGTGKMMTYDVSKIDEADGYVILAHKDGVTGEIVAAAQLKR